MMDADINGVDTTLRPLVASDGKRVGVYMTFVGKVQFSASPDVNNATFTTMRFLRIKYLENEVLCSSLRPRQ
jgi:hypothetical protein